MLNNTIKEEFSPSRQEMIEKANRKENKVAVSLPRFKRKDFVKMNRSNPKSKRGGRVSSHEGRWSN